MVMVQKQSRFFLFHRARGWLSYRLTAPEPRRRRIITASVIIFLIALGIRLLHWQDNRGELARLDALPTGLSKHYQHEAQRMIREGRLLFPREVGEQQQAQLLAHTPGYSILLAAFFSAFGEAFTALRFAHAVCDALAAALVFLIAAELLPIAAALIAALLTAFSPHLAYYSLLLLPDALTALPILLAVYLLIRASRRPRLITVIASGALVGWSCWLRPNAMLLGLFLAALILTRFAGKQRRRYAAAFALAIVLVIAPITIRNWVIYHRFIPLSLGTGLNLIEGIADYDPSGRFGLPALDEDVARKDAEWHGRPDYAASLWSPDGIERDRYRFARGLAVVRENPGWFLGVMLRRAGFMLRYNDSGPSRWPFGTAIVPVVAASPAYGNSFAINDGAQPVWSQAAGDLMANGSTVSAQTQAALLPDENRLRIAGDGSAFGDQFVSAPIPAQKHTDYILRVAVRLEQGPMAVKVTSADRKVALASAAIPEKAEDRGKKKKRKQDPAEATPTEPAEGQAMTAMQLPFASGERDEVRFVVSNNGAAAAQPMAQFGRAELYEMGPTPYQWTRYPRSLARGIQKNLYTTPRMLPLVLIGIALLALAGRWRALAALLAVPLYYLSIHSVLHTEYRYILAIHYFLFVFAAITLYVVGAAAWNVLAAKRRAAKRTT
ncbi:MAG TPA: glycosyltransferase family 39 protein [Blastocatellia bacterium]|nr:glycosyltransferase family 39 protein [Blastocatellia bacterium]